MSLTDGPAPMKVSARSRSTRNRPAKAPLSVDSVVEAALAILMSDGLDAVTMRRVAAALDTGAASLYVYVPNREGLLRAMLDRVIAPIEFEAPDPSRWRLQLHSLLQRLHDVLVAHPGIAAMTLADPPTTEAVLRLTENLLGILLAGGLDAQDAAWTCDISMLLVMGTAREDDVRRPHERADDDRSDDRDLDEQVDEIYQIMSGLPPERFPLLTAHAAQMVAGTAAERFRFAIDVVIDGVVARAARR
jgi:AcrR family transcriptional regulator